MPIDKRVLTVKVELPHYTAADAVKHTGEITEQLEKHYGVDEDERRTKPRLLGVSVT